MPWLAVLLILAGFIVVIFSRLDHFAWSDDEAVFVLTARAVQQGGRLYDEIWFNYPPGFLQLLNAAFAVGGSSLSTARIAVMCCALLALLLVTGLSRSLSSSWGGVFTALFVVTAPHFLALSGTVMTEVPAIGLATGAMWAALSYHRTGHRRWLVLSSLAFCASLWVKPTMMPTLAVLLLAVWLTERTVQRRLASATLLIALTVFPLVVGLLLHNPTGFLHQFGLTYLRSKSAFELDLPGNARDLAAYFLVDKYGLSHLSLLLLGVWGWSRLWHRDSDEAILLGAWFASAAMMLLFHAPLYRHHLIQLQFPVAVLAGLGLQRMVVTLPTYRQPLQMAVRGILLVITGAELVFSLRVDLVTLPSFESDDAEMGEEAVRYVQETTRSDDYLITDAHIIALQANRPVPPELTNTSRMRIRTGQLTSQQMIDVARRVQPAAVVFWEKKFDSLDDFSAWVACQYDLGMRLSERHRIYRPRGAVTSEDVAIPLNVYFGQSILLLGYSAKPQPAQLGNSVEVTLYWKAVSMPGGDFRVFVQLADAEGTIVGQEDSAPHAGECPTRVWQPGQVISDTHVVDVDRVGAGGPYRLVVSLHDGEGHRLSPFDSLGYHFPDDQVTLGISTVAMRREFSLPTPQHLYTATLDVHVKLLGYDLVRNTIRPGESIALTLYWRCLREMTTSYTVFTHLINGDGRIRGQLDRLPAAGRRPTVGWLTDEVIVDQYTIPLQKEAPPEDYRIEVGMYDWRTGQRLSVFDETGRRVEFDRVLLDTPIRVTGQ